MTGRTTKIAVLAGLCVAVVAVLTWQLARLLRPRPFRVQAARITKLDAAGRSGEIEFRHPKSGRMTTVAANIPADCAIWIDGVRGDVADLRVGDTVAVRGLFFPVDQSARPEEIRVTRAPATGPAASATAPADQAP